MKLYFISGLGADGRVFKNIVLPQGYEAVHLSWIQPGAKETLEQYALRMSEKIDPREKFSVIGLSFGGMIATEIAKFLSPQHTILISSVPSHDHLPPYYKWLGTLGLQKWLPMKWLKNASLIKRFFSIESKEDKAVIRMMIQDCDINFLKWAIGTILQWKNKIIPAGIIHIHGSSDMILPLRNTNPTHVIRKGSHIMVMNRAAEINQILREKLK